MNPIFSPQENRLRAWLRVPFYIFFAFFLASLGGSIDLNGFEPILTMLLTLGFFWISFRFMDNRYSIKESGLLQSLCWWQEVLMGVLFAAIALSILFIIELASGDIEIINFGWESGGYGFWLWPVFLFFIKMISVGFYEEVIMRSYLLTNVKEGFTYPKISTRLATIIGVVVSSSIFAIAHLWNPNVTVLSLTNIFLAGIMLAVPFILTGRLALSIGIHFSWNFFQGGVFGFRVSGISVRNSIINIKQGGVELWTGRDFGPEGGLIGLLGILLVTAFCLIYIKKSEGKIALHPMFKRSYLENQQSLIKADELA